VVIDKLLAHWQAQGDKVLLFTQTQQMLDILQRLVQQRRYSYHRMDGSTAIATRSRLIDDFNSSSSKAFVFLLTTKVCPATTHHQGVCCNCCSRFSPPPLGAMQEKKSTNLCAANQVDGWGCDGCADTTAADSHHQGVCWRYCRRCSPPIGVLVLAWAQCLLAGLLTRGQVELLHAVLRSTVPMYWVYSIHCNLIHCR
jgi:Helicase conserved C-terminal domain